MSILINNKEGYFADLHIHSRFSRACSKDLNIETLEKWAKVKGIDLLGTGDFTHPLWLKELKDNLIEKNGVLYTRTGFRFILTGEIALIYTQGRGRRVHLVLWAPSFEVVDKINAYFDKKGRRDYDGRPIFKISCEEFTKDMMNISSEIEIIPAHAWTPWFGIYGSESGFDSLKEAFGSQLEHIHAIETGISSTPEMNLRLNELHGKTIVSSSDSHSYWPWRLGREATIFSSIDSYKEIIGAIRKNEIIGTIEVNPAYGKYHYDGHRLCNFSCSPEETKKLNGICPVCHKQLLLGVEYRVEQLTDSKIKKDTKIVFEVLPLHEILSASLKSGVSSKKIWNVYNNLIGEFGTEFFILLTAGKEKLLKIIDEKTTDLILRNRVGKIKVKPGYDGLYGEMVLEDSLEEKQKTLF